MAVVILILVALLVSAAVFLVASTSADQENPLRDFRRAVRARRHPAPEDEAAARAAAADPVDVSLAEFLRATVSEGDGYLHPDELVEDLRSARERASHALRHRRDPHDRRPLTSA